LGRDLPVDQVKAEQGRETVDEKRSFDQALQIDIHRLGQPLSVRINDEHLTGMNENRFPDTVFAKHSSNAFEDDKLNEGIRMILEQHSCARDGGGHRRGVDFGAAGIFRNTQEHRAAAEIEISRSLGETKNGVCAQARESLVRKSEFSPGFDAGPHGGAFTHFIADHRGTRGGLRWEQLHIFDYLADASLFELGAVCCT